MTSTMTENAEREERRERQRELVDRLKASGALDGIFEQIDAGRLPLGGDDGLLKGLLKAALERGLEVELTDHVGYERGDQDASLFPNSRNGTTSKTVSSEVGDVELAVPRDRNGSFTPQLVPKGVRRLGGLDDMIISLYAGGMTLRDIRYQIQALDRTQQMLPMQPGHAEQRSHDQVRYGITTLFAALEIATGKVTGLCKNRHRHQEFLGFLKHVARAYPDGELHLVMDNYPARKRVEIRTWLAANPRIQVHFTPTSGSSLNLVEVRLGSSSAKPSTAAPSAPSATS